MLSIRYQRFGKKHQPVFRVVLTESTNSAKSGRFKEILGWYNPYKKTHALEKERILHWLSRGARPSGTAHNLFVSKGIIEGKKVHVSKSSKPAPKEAPKDDTLVPAEKPVA